MSNADIHTASEEKTPDNFIQKLIGLLIGSDDPEKEKRRQLKEIGKLLKKQKFNYYKPKSKEAMPPLARYFYEIYNVLGPARILLDNAANSAVLRTIFIESSLSEKQMEIKESLREEVLREELSVGDPREIVGKIKARLVSYFSFYDSEKIGQIEELYRIFQIFQSLINFDFYFLLKKFDSRLPENDFVFKPHFDPINGEYITEELKDFLEIIPFVERGDVWDKLFDVLKEYKQTEVLNRNSWRKITRAIVEIRKSQILVLMVRHLDSDPSYTPKVYTPDKAIVEDYLTKLRTQTEMTIQKILKEKQNKKIDNLLLQIYGTTAISRMKNYTEKANLMFSKKMLGGYIHVDPLNYLKAFLLDYFKRDVREICDLLLIRGKWTTNVMSQQLSEAFHKIVEISDELITFDDSLGEEGDLGILLRSNLKKADRNKASLQILRLKLKESNDKALQLIQESALAFIVIGKNVKNALDDYKKNPHEMLINWKELEAVMDGQVEPRFVEIYKKIYFFIQLVQFYVKKKS